MLVVVDAFTTSINGEYFILINVQLTSGLNDVNTTEAVLLPLLVQSPKTLSKYQSLFGPTSVIV